MEKSQGVEKEKFEERYSRQILFSGIGAEGQRQLAAGRVAIVGCGATGSALASLLAAKKGAPAQSKPPENAPVPQEGAVAAA